MKLDTAKRALRRLTTRAYRAVACSPQRCDARTTGNLARNRSKSGRRLEIGGSENPLPDFETLDIAPNPHVDYVLDATRPLPFPEGSFELVYASHILEHVPWFQTEDVLREWVRILHPGGQLEVWVPDGVKICKAFVDFECEGDNHIDRDGWYRYNPEKDVCKWASGRIFTYGDGNGDPHSPNWHRALFSARYLKLLFERAGLVDVVQMDGSEVRGYDHGWINLGIKGRKP